MQLAGFTRIWHLDSESKALRAELGKDFERDAFGASFTWGLKTCSFPHF